MSATNRHPPRSARPRVPFLTEADDRTASSVDTGLTFDIQGNVRVLHDAHAWVDLVRTFGWGDYASKAHCVVWCSPEIVETLSED